MKTRVHEVERLLVLDARAVLGHNVWYHHDLMGAAGRACMHILYRVCMHILYRVCMHILYRVAYFWLWSLANIHVHSIGFTYTSDTYMYLYTSRLSLGIMLLLTQRHM